MNFTDFYSKLLKNLYDCNFALNLVKKNDVPLLWKYGSFARSELYGNFASLVLAVVTAKSSVYRISFKSVNFYCFTPPYWIRYFEFMSYEL